MIDFNAAILPRHNDSDGSFGCGVCEWKNGKQVAQCPSCRAGALRELFRETVEEAFREGYNEGIGDGHPMATPNTNKAWERSYVYDKVVD